MLDRIPMQILLVLLSVVVIAAFWHVSMLYGDPAPIFAGLSLQIIGLFLAAMGIKSALKKIDSWLNGIELVQGKKRDAIASLDPGSLMAFGEELEETSTAEKNPAKQKSAKKRIKELELDNKKQKKRERQLREQLESRISQAVREAGDQVDQETEQLLKQRCELARITSHRRYVLLGLSWIVAGMLICAKASLIS